VKVRLLLALLAAALLLAACTDDGGEDEITADPDDLTAPSVAEPTGTTVGPTEGGAACADLADRYVRQARRMFDTQGTPSDELVDEVRARLSEFDSIASTAGCGEEYVAGVCEGLDALTHEGLLVILPLTTAQCL
jgi:hypothetical protein